MRVESLLSLVLEVDPEEITPTTQRADLAGWDSLAHLSVVAAVEETYDVRFSTAEMAELTSVPAIRAVLSGRGVDG